MPAKANVIPMTIHSTRYSIDYTVKKFVLYEKKNLFTINLIHNNVNYASRNINPNITFDTIVSKNKNYR